MPVALESQLVISADDRTAAAFASVQAKLANLQSIIAATDKLSGSPALANAGAFAGPGAALAEHTEALERQARAANAVTPAFSSTAADLLGSMAAAAGAFAALKIAGEGAAQAFDQQHEEVRMQAAGMTPAEIEDAQKLAAGTMKEYPSIQQSDAMALARNTRSIVGKYEEAAELMPDIASLFVVAQGSNVHAGPEELTHDFEQLLKGIESRGGTQDPKEFRQMMEGIAKALNVFGDTLKPYDYYQMIKFARLAGVTLSDEFMIGAAPSIAQVLRGSSAGRAFSEFNRAIVGGHIQHEGWQELLSLGLVREEDISRTKTGEIKGLLPGHRIAGAAEAEEDQFRWVQDYLLPALKAHGITDAKEIGEHIGRFTDQYAGQIMTMYATQPARVAKDLALEKGAPGLGAAKTFAEEDVLIAGEGLWNAIKSDIAGFVPADLLAKAAHESAGVLLTQPPSMAATGEDLAKQLRAALGQPSRAELLERYGQGPAPTIEDITREPSRHALGEARRIQDEMEKDREAARGAALMAMPSAADAEAARKLAAASALPVRPAQMAAPGPQAINIAPMAAGSQHVDVGVNGQAQVEQTLHLDISLDPALRAVIDQLTGSNFSVPLMPWSAPTGVMDTDAAPQRGGIGAM
jgi:hypothetical protein